MKKVVIESYGQPEDVVRCITVPDVKVAAKDDVVFDVLAFPINPADLSFCRGNYRLKPVLPATPGAECVGRVVSVGAAVHNVREGDLVINLDRENWAQRRRVKANRVVALRPDTDLVQAAMLRINPPTARLLLEDFVTLAADQWIIQNVANSSVGRLVALLAKDRGIKTVNVVRSQPAFDDLQRAGADAVVLDGDDLAQRVKSIIGEQEIRFGLDAVGGDATARISSCLAPRGTVCVYGSMSGKPVSLPTSELVYRGIRFAGFILGRHLDEQGCLDVGRFYGRLANDLERLEHRIAVEKVYGIDDIKDAVAHAQRSRSAGKILVAPNGAVG